MRLLISGGGTGGHVYPALAVVAQLAKASAAPPASAAPAAPSAALNEPELLWVGTTGRLEQGLVERAGVRFQGIESGQMRGINPLAALVSAGKMVRGVRQSLAILRSFQPQVCFVTGGYVCVPVVVACHLRKVPVLIYLPDIVPGWAIRSLSRLAQRVAVTLPAAAGAFGGEVPQGKAVVTGYPVREELLAATGGGQLDAAAHAQNRRCRRRQLAAALQRPHLAPDESGASLPLLLVFGGSQGARNLNQSTWAALPQLLPQLQLLHVVGERDWPLFLEQAPTQGLTPELSNRYHPVAYLHDEMALALAAADLALARAGASTLGEFPVARLPSILVPLVGVNQQQNAEALVEQGAAVLVADEQLPNQLVDRVLELAQDAPRRRQMEAALAGLARPEAGRAIAEELVRLGRGDRN